MFRNRLAFWAPLLGASVSLGALAPLANASELEPEFGTPEIGRVAECSLELKVTAKTGEGIEANWGDFNYTLPPEQPFLQNLCTIRIPVNIPSEFQAQWSNVQWQGKINLTEGGSATAYARVFFDNSDGTLISHNYSTAGESELNLNIQSNASWTPCGQASHLTILVRTVLRRSAIGPNASVSLKPGKLKLAPLIYKRCEP